MSATYKQQLAYEHACELLRKHGLPEAVLLMSYVPNDFRDFTDKQLTNVQISDVWQAVKDYQATLQDESSE